MIHGLKLIHGFMVLGYVFLMTRTPASSQQKRSSNPPENQGGEWPYWWQGAGLTALALVGEILVRGRGAWREIFHLHGAKHGLRRGMNHGFVDGATAILLSIGFVAGGYKRK